jgi:hypothetical protein
MDPTNQSVPTVAMSRGDDVTEYFENAVSSGRAMNHLAWKLKAFKMRVWETSTRVTGHRRRRKQLHCAQFGVLLRRPRVLLPEQRNQLGRCEGLICERHRILTHMMTLNAQRATWSSTAAARKPRAP